MRLAYTVAVLATLLVLLPRAARIGMTGDYVDSIGKITAQDEALCGHSAIHMAQHGDWLTPHFMGGLPLYKPPLLIWTSALSAKLLGVTRLALRLPVLFIAALAFGLIFLWGAETAGPIAGASAALLLLGNHLFHTLSTLLMTDVMLLAFTIAAVYAIYSDPWLESRAALWTYAIATAAAVLTKGIAGAFPFAILAMYWMAVRPQERPRLTRVLSAWALALALATPWFFYQLAAHPKWFWTEHVKLEILAFGAGAPPQTSNETTAVFYLLRLVATDPILFAASVIAAPAFLRILMKRTSGPVLLVCWLVLTATATLAWQYRNASYVLALVPSLALIAACYGAFAERRHASWMLAFVCFGLALKATIPDAPWGLNYRAGSVNPAADSLTRYCQSPHARQLIVVNVADDLYASLLPLHIRYAGLGSIPRTSRYGMPFRELGLVLTVDEFLQPDPAAPYRSLLREWGIPTDQPVGTFITASTPRELADLVRRSPDSDFLVPIEYQVTDPSHTAEPAGRGLVLLRAKTHVDAVAPPGGNCRM